MVRTRVAVSPTGYPHIGTIYQSLFDYAYAKKNNGKFIVRIEDTDRERFVADAEEKLYQALDWFGLKEDESPRKGGPFSSYRQSERLPLYQKFAKELVEKVHAYYCFCSKERLEQIRQQQQKEKKPLMYDKHCRDLPRETIEKNLAENKEKVIRLKVPQNETIVVHDEIRGDIKFDSNLVDDQVLLKSDGYPTYHLAVVVDDHEMEITHVVRGEEWLSSTPKHFLLYKFFGWQRPLFYHTAALRNPDHSKLSKRQGHTNVTFYREEGYLPQAILNYIALLGWSHSEGKEIFSLDEFVRLFDLNDIKPIGPIFDLKKLEWMNGMYIRMMDIDTLVDIVKKYEKEITNRSELFNSMDDVTFKKIVSLAQTRMNVLREFFWLARHFVEDPSHQTSISQKNKEISQDLLQQLEKLEPWDKDTLLEVLRAVLKKHTIKMNKLYFLLTGRETGLPLPESLEILGKEKTLKRLQNLVS